MHDIETDITFAILPIALQESIEAGAKISANELHVLAEKGRPRPW